MFEKSMSEAREGTVTMPLSEYDGIIRELTRYQSMFTLRKRYDGDIDVEINKEITVEIGRALFAQGNYPAGGYVLYDDDLYTPSVTIAKPVRKEEKTDV